MNLFDFTGMSTMSTGQTVVWMLILVWSLAWKGWALWRAAQNKALAWYIAILVLSTIGILEIIYIFFFSGYGKKKV